MTASWDDIIVAYEENLSCLEEGRRHYEEVSGSFLSGLCSTIECLRLSHEFPDDIASSPASVVQPAGETARFAARVICHQSLCEILSTSIEVRLAAPAGGRPKHFWIGVSKTRDTLKQAISASPIGKQWLVAGRSDGISPTMAANNYLWCREMPVSSDEDTTVVSLREALDYATGLIVESPTELQALARLYAAGERAFLSSSKVASITSWRAPAWKMDGWWLSAKGPSGAALGGGIYIDPGTLRALVVVQNSSPTGQSASSALATDLAIRPMHGISKHDSFEVLSTADLLGFTPSEIARRISNSMAALVRTLEGSVA